MVVFKSMSESTLCERLLPFYL